MFHYKINSIYIQKVTNNIFYCCFITFIITKREIYNFSLYLYINNKYIKISLYIYIRFILFHLI